MKRIIYFGCSLLLMTALASPTFARAVAAVQDDATRYTEFFNEENPQKKAELGEKFLADFKKSQWVDAVYRTTVSKYYEAGNWAKVIALVAQMEQLSPETTPANKGPIYARGMDAALKTNNAAQTIAFGDKVLAIAPDDLNTLITLSSTIPVAMPQDKAAIDKAEGYATRAIAVLGKMDAKSLGLSEADWAKQKVAIEGTLHNTLGSIYFNKGDYDKAVEELQNATKINAKDGASWYLLGLAFNQQYAVEAKTYQDAVKESNDLIKSKSDRALIEDSQARVSALQDAAREKRDQAIAALATSVACGGTTKDPAMAQLTKLWSTKNNGSTDGLNEFINSKKPAQ